MVKESLVEPNNEVLGLFALINSLRDQLALLAFSGVAGAFFRALLAPEQKWGQRIAQGVGGALSALFLGGFAAQITDQLFDAGHWAWLAWGFIMGSGGEVAVKYVQEKMMGKNNGTPSSTK